MKKLLLFLGCFILTLASVQAQKYITKTGYIRFYSDSPLEKIEAINRQVNAILNISNGDFVFKVLMKSFQFEKALMQEHFNENYVESDKFPAATFVGKVITPADVFNGKDGQKEAIVEGKLTMHGVTRYVKEKGSFETKGNRVVGKAKFNILLADYNIKIPGAVTNNISKTIEITVDVILDKLNP